MYIQATSVEFVLETIEELLGATDEQLVFIWDSLALTPAISDIEGDFNDNMVVMISLDNGTTWTEKNFNASYGAVTTSVTITDVTYGNGTFVAVCNYSNNLSWTPILTSSNGVSWTTRATNLSTMIRKTTFGSNIFVATLLNGGIITSSDNGTSWTTRNSGTSTGLYGVTSP